MRRGARWTRSSCGALSALALACGPERIELASPDLSEDIAWAALVFEASSGAMRNATGLLPVAGGRIELESPGDDATTIVLYAYREEDLPDDMTRDPTELQAPLVRAQIEDPILPTPSVQSRTELVDGSSFVRDSVHRDLTAPWLPPCAARAGAQPDAAVLVDCVPRSCYPLPSQNGCHVKIELGGICGLGVMDLKLSTNGDFEVRESHPSLGECLSTTPRPEGDLAVNCLRDDLPECRIDLYPASARMRLDTQATKLIPDAPDQFIGRARLGGPALLDEDELVVSVATEASCTPGATQQLAFLDRATLEVTRTATTPFCVPLMTKDPHGDGFVGLTRAPVSAVRYDRAGRLIESRPIEGLSGIVDPLPIAWGLAPEGGSAAVWISNFYRPERVQNVLAEVRWQDLTVSGSVNWPGDAHYPVALTPGGFVLMDDDADMVRYFDRVGGTELDNVPIARDSLTNRALWSMVRIGDGNRVLIHMNETLESVTVVDEARRVRRIVDSELTQPLHTSAPIPGQESRFLMGGGSALGPAEFVVFDTDSEYFLPGRTELTILDQPSNAVSDGLDPYVFMILSNTAHVVRVHVLP